MSSHISRYIGNQEIGPVADVVGCGNCMWDMLCQCVVCNIQMLCMCIMTYVSFIIDMYGSNVGLFSKLGC